MGAQIERLNMLSADTRPLQAAWLNFRGQWSEEYDQVVRAYLDDAFARGARDANQARIHTVTSENGGTVGHGTNQHTGEIQQ